MILLFKNQRFVQRSLFLRLASSSDTTIYCRQHRNSLSRKSLTKINRWKSSSNICSTSSRYSSSSSSSSSDENETKSRTREENGTIVDFNTVMDRIEALESRVRDLETKCPKTFRAGHYNMLAKYLGSNKEPWFLFGGLSNSKEDLERSKAIGNKHREKSPSTGQYVNVGWPSYVRGILTEEEITRVEEMDRSVFAWDVRSTKIIKQIKDLQADLLSIVEMDEYYELFKAELKNIGLDSIWVKRPRQSSYDGCCVCWKASKFDLLANEPFHYNDNVDGTNKRDRTALITLFRLRQHANSKWIENNDNNKNNNGGRKLIFVSTHLARNPECKEKHMIRLRQTAQLMVQLKDFANKHGCDESVPVIVAGDWNVRSLNEIRAVTQAFFALQKDYLKSSMHPLLLGSIDVPTPPTSFTLQRQSRIDYLLYSESLLRLKNVERIKLQGRSAITTMTPTTIPNHEHPSDHLPISADFEYPTEYEISRDCAKRFCTSIVHGNMRRPMLPNEIKLAFDYFDHDGSETITPQELIDGVHTLGIGDSQKEIDHLIGVCCTAITDGDGESRKNNINNNHKVATLETFELVVEKLFFDKMRCGDSFYTAAHNAFQFFDLNGDGKLCRDEIATTLRSISPATIDDTKIEIILEEIDTDHDGNIDFDDFISTLVKVHQDD